MTTLAGRSSSSLMRTARRRRSRPSPSCAPPPDRALGLPSRPPRRPLAASISFGLRHLMLGSAGAPGRAGRACRPPSGAGAGRRGGPAVGPEGRPQRGLGGEPAMILRVRPVRDGVMEQLFLDCPVDRKSMFLLPYLFCLLTPRSVLRYQVSVPCRKKFYSTGLSFRPRRFPHLIYRF